MKRKESEELIAIKALYRVCGDLFSICRDLYDSKDARIQEAAHSLEELKQLLYRNEELKHLLCKK